ncbi:MAG: alpha/beta fold hydrolase, partial [Solirubrobacteraceae bacterium]
MRSAVVLLAVLLGSALVVSGCSSAPKHADSALQRRLLSIAQLPAGWSVSATSAGAAVTDTSCLSTLRTTKSTKASDTFTQGGSVPAFGEELVSEPNFAAKWVAVNQALAACRNADLTVGGKPYRFTIAGLPLPTVGARSAAYSLKFTISGIEFDSDLVWFEAGTDLGVATYTDLGSPDVAIVHAFAAAAVAKVDGSPAPVTGVISVASTPVRTAQTALGTVGYRVLGSGPPLVLIMGYAGTMEVWDPLFVDALAEHYRVVVFDNAGVGLTSALRSPLTIDAMADQTSALITALHLGRP